MDQTDLPLSLGEWIKRRRRLLDLTQAELAQRVGCSLPALRKIESGERKPSKQLAALIARALEIPPEQHANFIKVARGDLSLERLRSPSTALASTQVTASPASGRRVILPVPPTPLVGREPELAALERLIKDSQCRLLNLVGPGGIGKTRLAIELGTRQQQFADGVYFVPLVSIDSPAFLVPAIADALDLTFQGQAELPLQLLNYLRTRHLLLVLDNAERLLVGMTFLTELLENAPGVKLLVTSRERLKLHSEWVFEIQGLVVPPAGQLERVEDYSAAALFVRCARKARADFELKPAEQQAVVRICQLVEGMPLGIELAAAWVAMLDCTEIAQEIEHNLDFLATSMRDVPERQRSLRAVFDYSWSLLSDSECGLLSRLAVFQGGFTRQAAAAIARATLPDIHDLVSKSLVRRKENGRFDLHEVVRQYAFARFVDDPGYDEFRNRHCDYYLALLADRLAVLQSTAQREALRELVDEIDNVRAAWIWAIQHEKFPAMGPALRSFALLCDLSGWYSLGIEQLDLIVQAIHSRTPTDAWQRVLGQTLAQQGDLLFRVGHFDQALIHLDESLAILRPIGDPALLAPPLVFSGTILHLVGQMESSIERINEGLLMSQKSGDQWYIAFALFNQGYIASLLGDYQAGYVKMLDGIALWRKLGDPRYTALGLNFISTNAIFLGYHAEAQAFLEESLALCTQVGDRWGTGTAYRNLGLAALARGEPVHAQELIRKSLEIFTEFATGWDIVRSLVFLGQATAAAGDSLAARGIFLDALQKGIEVQSLPLALDALNGLADLFAQAGAHLDALTPTLLVLQHPASTQEAKDHARLLLSELETRLPAASLEAARVEAPSLSLQVLAGRLSQVKR